MHDLAVQEGGEEKKIASAEKTLQDNVPGVH